MVEVIDGKVYHICLYNLVRQMIRYLFNMLVIRQPEGAAFTDLNDTVRNEFYCE